MAHLLCEYVVVPPRCGGSLAMVFCFVAGVGGDDQRIFFFPRALILLINIMK